MTVYAEYAFAENFCMDFVLLFIAKAATKNPCKYWRLAVTSALGACFAVLYPLFGVGGVLGVVIKLAAGFLMCAAAGKFQSFKGYLKFAAVFAGATFLLGGALIAIFALAKVEYKQGGGYLLSSVPVGIPLFFAVVIAIGAVKLKRKFVQNKKVEASLKIYSGGNTAVCKAFYDSGNKVYSGGVPVSIVPKFVAMQLTDTTRIKTFVDIHTVAGKSKIAVFTADKIEIDDGKSIITRQNVALGVSPRHINRVVLHPDLSEVI